jgi:hypothetical protein
MRVLNEDEEHRLAVVDLLLDIGGSALICKKRQYSLSTAGCQVTTHLRGKQQTAPELRYGLTIYVWSLQLPDPAQLPLLLMALRRIRIYEFTRGLPAINAVIEPLVST